MYNLSHVLRSVTALLLVGLISERICQPAPLDSFFFLLKTMYLKVLVTIYYNIANNKK
jgi:hypothetical protein